MTIISDESTVIKKTICSTSESIITFLFNFTSGMVSTPSLRLLSPIIPEIKRHVKLSASAISATANITILPLNFAFWSVHFFEQKVGL